MFDEHELVRRQKDIVQRHPHVQIGVQRDATFRPQKTVPKGIHLG